MLKSIKNINQILWSLAELGFLLVIICVLIFLVLGPNSGALVLAVMDNVFSVTRNVDAANLIGITIIIAILYVVKARFKL